MFLMGYKLLATLTGVSFQIELRASDDQAEGYIKLLDDEEMKLEETIGLEEGDNATVPLKVSCTIIIIKCLVFFF